MSHLGELCNLCFNIVSEVKWIEDQIKGPFFFIEKSRERVVDLGSGNDKGFIL